MKPSAEIKKAFGYNNPTTTERSTLAKSAGYLAELIALAEKKEVQKKAQNNHDEIHVGE